MIKVMKKLFDVLEYVAEASGRPVMPAEVMSNCDLNSPTCTRILKDLLELGYLEQTGIRQGYTLGPMSFHLGGGKSYLDELTRRADPLIFECAREIGQTVVLATRHLNWRYVLSVYNFNLSHEITTQPTRHRDLYCTASGRLLLAFAPKKDFDMIVEKEGLPTNTPSPKFWAEVSGSKSSLKEELQQIRSAGFVENKNSTYYSVAFPVYRNDKMVAALAASWPMVDLPEKVKKDISVVRELSESLSGAPEKAAAIG